MRSCERAVHQPVSRSSGLPTDTAACGGRIAQPIESAIPAECASSSSGAEEYRKEEHHDVTERQAHGSQPV